MTTTKNSNKLQSSKGETLIELLISIFILTITLTLIISVFMSGRAGIVESWNRTEKIECAKNVMEQLKVLPYDTLTSFIPPGKVEKIGIDFTEIPASIDEKLCEDLNDVKFDVHTYNTYSRDNIVQVNVRVKKGSTDKEVEIGSLIRKGDD